MVYYLLHALSGPFLEYSRKIKFLYLIFYFSEHCFSFSIYPNEWKHLPVSFLNINPILMFASATIALFLKILNLYLLIHYFLKSIFSKNTRIWKLSRSIHHAEFSFFFFFCRLVSANKKNIFSSIRTAFCIAKLPHRRWWRWTCRATSSKPAPRTSRWTPVASSCTPPSTPHARISNASFTFTRPPCWPCRRWRMVCYRCARRRPSSATSVITRTSACPAYPKNKTN